MMTASSNVRRRNFNSLCCSNEMPTPQTSVECLKLDECDDVPVLQQNGHIKKNESTAESFADNVEEETSFTTRLLPEEFVDEEASFANNIKAHVPDEAAWQIGLQVFLPYLIAGLGMVGAGLVLNKVQHWDVFTKVSEVLILVPALLGLKGNLEMTLASRLSTQANLGNMDTTRKTWSMAFGNLALVQLQAVVVGLLASVAAMVLGWIPAGKFEGDHGLLLCASAVFTASFASLILGFVMVSVVLLSRKCHINPDNVATPIAASLGDLTTLLILAGIGSFLYYQIEKKQNHWSIIVLVLVIGLSPLWIYISYKNDYTRPVLLDGWTPIIGAMVISSFGGLILDFTLSNYKGVAVFQPVINGVGGNLVAVQASRLSTALHRVSQLGVLPPNFVHGCPNLLTTFFGNDVNATTARVLLLLVIPGHLIFMYIIHVIVERQTPLSVTFVTFYLLAAVIQVLILLYVANWLVHFLWKSSNDPDNFAIPYLTALGDLLGTALLGGACSIMSAMGIKV